ncbi:redoxin domain-containing protein [Rhodocyclus tenuis]|uniref:peroxiredoxin n=1 Tax=Rhodocyclus gracilis TaxID=2929842 RepID=UPI001298CA3A|nr:peroxiredoxin [Rhodocyclus gracilis]MRD73832.1 redoxin domain-containing protein [Rhodocyclus gracilis]
MIDHPVADFSRPATGGKEYRLSDSLGHPVVLYFYPKDNTPGCTTEASDFRDLHAEFSTLGCQVIGVSRDSVKSHENFKTKLNLPFDLLSDADESLCNQFAVIKLKTMYGKACRGVERSTFVIDAKGVLRREWRGMKTAGHAREVLDYVRSL